jgi:hypothetical protein
LEHSFVWCGNLDSSETRSEVPGKFRNVVLEKDGEDKLDGPRKYEAVLQRVKEESNILQYTE